MKTIELTILGVWSGSKHEDPCALGVNFNPKENDRNLEFDPKRNLLENDEAGSVEFQ